MPNSVDQRYKLHLKIDTILIECSESTIPQMKEKVNRTWGYKGRTDVKDDGATLALRIDTALSYSALIREEGSIYHRTFNGTGEMIVEKWRSRRIEPIDNGTEFFGRIYKRDYIRGIRLVAEYLGISVEDIGKLTENLWLRPSHIVMNAQKAHRNPYVEIEEYEPGKKNNSKLTIPKPGDGRVYFFNLQELNNIRDRLKKGQRLYSRKGATKKQLEKIKRIKKRKD